jgi:hypothetical protein
VVAWREPAVRAVTAVDKAFLDHAEPARPCPLGSGRAGHQHQHQFGIEGADSVGHGIAGPFLVGDVESQRAVAFHVPHPLAEAGKDALQRAELVEQHRDQLVMRQVDPHLAEAEHVGVGGVRAELYAAFGQEWQHPLYDDRVA